MDSISTGEAARMLLVTRDAVLKWIKQGKLPAYQTPGGHHRIPIDFVRSLIPSILAPSVEDCRPTGSADNGMQQKYCWQHHITGENLRNECSSCLVFKVKGTQCYEVAEFLKKMNAGASCCPTGCEDCSFYKEQMEKAFNENAKTNAERGNEKRKTGQRPPVVFAEEVFRGRTAGNKLVTIRKERTT